MQRLVQEATQRAEQEATDNLIEINSRVLASSFDRSMAYTNALILAGYASFFGLWQLTKGSVSPMHSLSAALLISVSYVTFVAFEVYKSVFSSRTLLSLQNAMNSAAGAGLLEVQLLLTQHEKEMGRRSLTLT